MLKSLAWATLLVAGSVGSAQAIVISDTQILLSPSTQNGADYAITAIQAPDEYDPTTLWFSKVDGTDKSTLTPITWNVDQEADYYLAQAGASFTAQTVASGQFTPLFTTDRPYALDVTRPGDFYLGVATSTGTSSPRTVWGWVHLRNDDSGLSILGSAMAYGEDGIVIGTTTPVPEPATYMQLGVGLAVLALLRRGGQRRTTGRPAPI